MRHDLKRDRFAKHALALGLGLGFALIAPIPLIAQTTFNQGLLAFPVDASLFAEGNPVPPGTYRLDVYLNNTWQGKHDVRFETLARGDRIAQPCFDAGLLDALGLDTQHVAADMLARLAAGEAICAPLDALFANARSHFDTGLQRLELTAPQVLLARRPRGYVDPRRWDAGIAAARFGYDYNVWHNRQFDSRQTSQYLGLRAGFNVGDWRFRYRATVTRQTDAGTRYHHSAFFVERALPALRSALLAGETNTQSQVFDSLSFRGIRLESEERMRPDSRNGFAPVISGIAQSNAKVRVSQRGIPVFEMTVPPGPFVIDDLNPNGRGGDLLVTVSEADGSEHSFTVTYATLPQMLRPGVIRYSIAGGQYRDRNMAQEPLFGMGSVSVGVNNTVTAYGGLLFAQDYDAASMGLGLNLPVGAVTLDGTYARTFLPNKLYTGTGWRLAYNKRLQDTDTDFSLAMLRYATRDYFEPVQAFRLRDAIRRNTAHDAWDGKRRHQFSINVNQALPGPWGMLSLSGSVQDYWHRNNRDVQYSIGYGRSIGRVHVSVNATRSRNTYAGRWDNQYLLSLAVPLGAGSPVHLHSSITRRPDGVGMQHSISGTIGRNHDSQYGVYASADKNRGQGTTGSGGVNLSTTTPYARLSASASAGAGNSQQFGLNASGGVVFFKDGAVFTPELGETVAIVQAKDAAGANVMSARSVQLDGHGHAVVPYLQPYRENSVTLDPKGVSADVTLTNVNQKVVPTHGAVVLLEYQTQHGYAVLVRLRRPDTNPDSVGVPFAAGVFDAQDQNVGYVAQGQQALVRVDQMQGELRVRWGQGDDEQCRFDYDLTASTMPVSQGDGGGKSNKLRRLEVLCR